MHFTEVELDALTGTHLYSATLAWWQVWDRTDVCAVNREWGNEFTWCVRFHFVKFSVLSACHMDASQPHWGFSIHQWAVQ